MDAYKAADSMCLDTHAKVGEDSGSRDHFQRFIYCETSEIPYIHHTTIPLRCVRPSSSILRNRKIIQVPLLTPPTTKFLCSFAAVTSTSTCRVPQLSFGREVSPLAKSVRSLASYSTPLIEMARGGRGGNRRLPQTREVMISKALSFLLRHGGLEEGVEMDEGGWANVADVVSWFYLFCWLLEFAGEKVILCA